MAVEENKASVAPGNAHVKIMDIIGASEYLAQVGFNGHQVTGVGVMGNEAAEAVLAGLAQHSDDSSSESECTDTTSESEDDDEEDTDGASSASAPGSSATVNGSSYEQFADNSALHAEAQNAYASILGSTTTAMPVLILRPGPADTINATTGEPGNSSTAATAHVERKAEGQKQAPEVLIYPADMVITVSGTVADMMTPVNDFRNWSDYRLFCHLSEMITLKFGNTTDEDKFIQQMEMKIPKKLLCDFSRYFDAMFRGPWTEAATGIVEFRVEDVDPRVFIRVVDMLYSGYASPDMSGPVKARTVDNITEHVRCYIVADRFNMDAVMEWIKAAMDAWMVWLIHNWKTELDNAAQVASVTQEPISDEFRAMQKRRVQDFSSAYSLIAAMEPERRPVQPEHLADTLMQACPPGIIVHNLDSLDLHFAREIARALLS